MKKILLTLAAVVAVTAGVVGMSAFEAHIINVTAHIENALKVNTRPIAFGTVFPQEYLTQSLEIALSGSFMEEGRVDDVKYVIKQKMKPCPVVTGADGQPRPVDPTCVPDDPKADPPTVPHNPTGWHYQDLCKYLSKTNSDPDGILTVENDVSHRSYYVDNDPQGPSASDTCQAVTGDASGVLAKGIQDTVDAWIVDLKVPPVAGNIGQDWPQSCANYVLVENNQTYGCDLWIEVTEISPD